MGLVKGVGRPFSTCLSCIGNKTLATIGKRVGVKN